MKQRPCGRLFALALTLSYFYDDRTAPASVTVPKGVFSFGMVQQLWMPLQYTLPLRIQPRESRSQTKLY